MTELNQNAAVCRKKALYIVDLDDPWEAVKTLHQQSKFEVRILALCGAAVVVKVTRCHAREHPVTMDLTLTLGQVSRVVYNPHASHHSYIASAVGILPPPLSLNAAGRSLVWVFGSNRPTPIQ